MNDTDLFKFFILNDYRDFVQDDYNGANNGKLMNVENHISYVLNKADQNDSFTARYFVFSYPGCAAYFPECYDVFINGRQFT